LRALVVGTGHIGRQHILCLSRLDGVELVGVCDRSAATAAMIAERYGIGAAFTSAEEAIETARPDVVHVTTPVGSHAPIARAALAAGAHVIVEKPAAATYEDVVEMVEAAKAAGRDLVEDYNYAFDPRVSALRDRLGRGGLGEFLRGEVAIKQNLAGAAGGLGDLDLNDGGAGVTAVADFLPHLCSLSHVLAGRSGRVEAIWRRDEVGRADVTALVEAERGEMTLSFSSRAQPDAATIRVECSGGQVDLGIFEPVVVERLPRGGPRPLTPLINEGLAALSLVRGAAQGLRRKFEPAPGVYIGLWQLVGLCYSAWREGSAPPISGEDILAVNRLERDILAAAPR
jgi:predicted dehydrogenase